MTRHSGVTRSRCSEYWLVLLAYALAVRDREDIRVGRDLRIFNAQTVLALRISRGGQ